MQSCFFDRVNAGHLIFLYGFRDRPAPVRDPGRTCSTKTRCQGFSCPRISPPGLAAVWTLTYRFPAWKLANCASVNFAPAGTAYVSPFFVSGMITVPFLPVAASWMCATVPAMPVVVTLPLTDLSAPMIIVPVPVPALLTGGTS